MCVCMYAQSCCKTGGGAGGISRRKLDALRLLLRQFWNRSRGVVATWPADYCIQFLNAMLYAFAKPAGIKFPRKKVPATVTEQQVG